MKSFDWTEIMDTPPTERTHIGYFGWVDTNDPDNYRRCRRDYYVLADGSAEIVSADEPVGAKDSPEVSSKTEAFAPGMWQVVYPTTTFGSRGGCWVRER